jgi:hypothetical protein
MTIHIPTWLFWFLIGGWAGIIIQDIRWKYRVYRYYKEGGDIQSQPSERDST